MLGISERAAELLLSILDDTEADWDECVRLAIRPDGIAIGIDTEREGDQVFTFQDRKVLVVDPATSEQFAEQILSVDGPDFCFVRPDPAERDGQLH